MSSDGDHRVDACAGLHNPPLVALPPEYAAVPAPDVIVLVIRLIRLLQRAGLTEIRGQRSTVNGGDEVDNRA